MNKYEELESVSMPQSYFSEMKRKLSFLPYGTVEYWKIRCEYLEKSIDPTRTITERDNCKAIYRMLEKKEQDASR